MDFCVRSGEQRAGGIVHIDFDQQCPGCHVDGFSSAHDFSLKLAVWKFRETEIRWHADRNPSRVFLGHVYVNAQCCRLSDVKEIGFHIAAAAGIDEVADIRVTRGDHAIERRVHLSKETSAEYCCTAA